jgi:hypothetical protein
MFTAFFKSQFAMGEEILPPVLNISKNSFSRFIE